jgi:LuxR family transcriptional regulator, maltose regulon positive regulatory protein
MLNSSGAPTQLLHNCEGLMETTLRLRFLGQFGIFTAAGWHRGPSLKKGGELLQYLGTYPRRIATKDELAAAFWPELDADTVAHRIHLAASGARLYLRRHLNAPDAMVSVVGGYAWSLRTTIRSDIEDFFTLCRRGLRESLEAAVAIYEGEFLSGETAEWIQPMRIRCASIYACALELLARHAESDGDFPAALNAGLRLYDAERGHEGATRLIMRCFAALGQRDRAESQFTSLREYLHGRLGVEPSEETAMLAREIRLGAIPSPESEESRTRRVYREFAERNGPMMVV